MADNFKIILFTPEDPVKGETEILNAALEMNAVDFVHLRHPRLDAAAICRIIEAINPQYRDRIRLHDNFELIDKYHLRGAQVNSRNKECPNGEHLPTRSCHTLDELKHYDEYEYVTLSPVFSSISKKGYNPSLKFEELKLAVSGKNVVALGGVQIGHLPLLEYSGFEGAAMLGAFWNVSDKMKEARRLKILRNNRFKLQYITNGTTPEEVEQEVNNVVSGGCRWVQVRMKDANEDIIEETLNRVKPACVKANAILLVDDKVELVNKCGIDGVHLGREDMAVDVARKILGDRAIIGSTANNLEQFSTLDFDAIDYAGVGPLRFTTTKKKLAPVLGLKGYEEILGWKRQHDCNLPIVAIGGITSQDVIDLMKMCIEGVAVSSAISASANPKVETRIFIEKIEECQKETFIQ